MKKTLTFIVTLIAISVLKTNAQGLNAGISSGTVGLFGFEIGYSPSETLHLGLTVSPKFNRTSTAGYLGVYGRKSFSESELFQFASIRPYLSATIGLITPPTESYGDMESFELVSIKHNKSIGGAVGGGIEILIGRSGKIASPLEIGLGKMPNAFSSLNNIYDPYDTGSQNSQKFTSVFYFQAGLRFYLSK